MAGTLARFVLAMCLLLDVQATAQEEIDSVVGVSRSPGWEDLDQGRLPFTSALAERILRRRSPAALRDIACETVDTIYRGYFVSKGTRINTRRLRNPRDLSDFDAASPERFLRDKQAEPKFVYSSDQPLAEQSFLSVLARLLWAFKIEPGLDEKVGLR